MDSWIHCLCRVELYPHTVIGHLNFCDVVGNDKTFGQDPVVRNGDTLMECSREHSAEPRRLLDRVSDNRIGVHRTYTLCDNVEVPEPKGKRVAESVAYRSIIVASQYASWLLGQLLRVRYSVHAYRPADLFEHRSEHCLILSPTHKSYLDPWLMLISLDYRHVRALVPVRILGTQDPGGALKWFMPLIKFMYWLAGVIELPPEDRDDRSLPRN